MIRTSLQAASHLQDACGLGYPLFSCWRGEVLPNDLLRFGVSP
jgi:hypothetical protein